MTSGTNNLTAAISDAATAGSTFARFRVSAVAGYSYSSLAAHGEVEDYQVTIVAAKSSSSRARTATTFKLWAATFVVQPSSPQTTPFAPQRDIGESIWSVKPSATEIVDLAIAEIAATEPRPHRVADDSSWLDEDLVDSVFKEEMSVNPNV